MRYEKKTTHVQTVPVSTDIADLD